MNWSARPVGRPVASVLATVNAAPNAGFWSISHGTFRICCEAKLS